MSAQPSPPLDPEIQAVWDSLRRAVANALERKCRLGQYAVVWDGEKPIAIGGDDAPEELKVKTPKTQTQD